MIWRDYPVISQWELGYTEGERHGWTHGLWVGACIGALGVLALVAMAGMFWWRHG